MIIIDCTVIVFDETAANSIETWRDASARRGLAPPEDARRGKRLIIALVTVSIIDIPG